ncbi:hypothetical protein RE628_25375 [Paenibacillus sp. D2_2]|uniref:hypothetical protein n=1 Tax=Paenibacillus sp. D2_2 TaxID=3073092 RepID=UPI00281533BA|nr:hypothetical protein [Paenibacillus sp. D2_2]WMT40483.1 hypothetical protein RE628_25375 [Paenibacillus sp. D2_2]
MKYKNDSKHSKGGAIKISDCTVTNRITTDRLRYNDVESKPLTKQDSTNIVKSPEHVLFYWIKHHFYIPAIEEVRRERLNLDWVSIFAEMMVQMATIKKYPKQKIANTAKLLVLPVISLFFKSESRTA